MVHNLTHQDHPQLKRTTTNMTLMITWSGGEEHPWFFFHEVPTKESQKLQIRLPYHRTRLDKILHTRPPLGYGRPCERLKLPIYRDI
jgi:hypothetical protein